MRPSIICVVAAFMLCGPTFAESVAPDPVAVTGGVDADAPLASSIPAVPAAEPASPQAAAPEPAPAPKPKSRFKSALKTTGYVALVVAFIAVRIMTAGH